MKKQGIRNGYTNIDLSDVLDLTNATSLSVGSTTSFAQDSTIISKFLQDYEKAIKSKKPCVVTIPQLTASDGTHTLDFINTPKIPVVSPACVVASGATFNVIRINTPNIACFYDTTNLRYLRSIIINGANNTVSLIAST